MIIWFALALKWGCAICASFLLNALDKGLGIRYAV